MASDGVTLDVVRTTVGEIPGAESSVDIAYDENGDRVWYSYSGTGQDRGFTEITVPGVGVYRADRGDGADGEFRLVRMDLVAGGYRDAGGSVHFPVKDAQGNVRGYASSAGLESAYDYYPYGTAVELSANGADDRRRWQGKEFDGEHGKYYFGARYFDPFFALWASPDPAGQFANPYSYGGDPVNYVDPSGEIVIAAIFAGAAVGAVIGGGTAVYQCNVHGQGDCSGSYVATSAVVGAAAGAAGGLAGGAVSGLGIGEGESAIVSGLASGAANSSTGYVLNSALTGQNMSLGAVFREAMLGSFSGAISGGIGAGVSDVLPKNALNPLIGEMSGSFASGFMESYMNGNIGFGDALIGGLQGAGIAGVSYGLSYGIGSLFAETMAADGAYYGDDENLKNMAKNMKKYHPDDYEYLGHYNYENEVFALDQAGTIGSIDPVRMGTLLANYNFNYSGQNDLWFYSCELGRTKGSWSGAQELSSKLPTKTIHAPTGRVLARPVYSAKTGRLIYVGTTIIDGGKWVAYRNGKIVY